MGCPVDVPCKTSEAYLVDGLGLIFTPWTLSFRSQTPRTSHISLHHLCLSLISSLALVARSLLEQSIFYHLGQNCLKSPRSVLHLLTNVFRNSIIIRQVVCGKNMCIMRKVHGTYSSGIRELLPIVALQAPSIIGPARDVRGTSTGQDIGMVSLFVEEPRSCKECPWDINGTGHWDVHMIHGRTKIPHRMSMGRTEDRTY